MRITVGIVEPLFEHVNSFLTKDVFDLLGVLMDVIGGKVRSVCKIKFPQPVIAHNFAGAVPTLRVKDAESPSLDMGDILMAAKCAELMLGLFERLVAALGKFTCAHLFDCEILILQDVVNGLKRVLAGNPGQPGALPPPARKNAMPRTEEERRANTAPAASTMKGPVGRLRPTKEKKAPAPPETIPKIAEKTSIIPSRWVKRNAAAAGMTSIAETSTTPTA